MGPAHKKHISNQVINTDLTGRGPFPALIPHLEMKKRRKMEGGLERTVFQVGGEKCPGNLFWGSGLGTVMHSPQGTFENFEFHAASQWRQPPEWWQSRGAGGRAGLALRLSASTAREVSGLAWPLTEMLKSEREKKCTLQSIKNDQHFDKRIMQMESKGIKSFYHLEKRQRHNRKKKSPNAGDTLVS